MLIGSTIGWNLVKLASLLLILLIASDLLLDTFNNLSTESGEDEDVNRDRVGIEVSEADQLLVLQLTEHCLPKLVCELFKTDPRVLSDSEQNLVDLIGSGSALGGLGSVSRYVFAAHMGQLSRGFEGQGCNNFYPQCPFSTEDVRAIAAKISL